MRLQFCVSPLKFGKVPPTELFMCMCVMSVWGARVCVCVKGGDPHHSLPCRLCELE